LLGTGTRLLHCVHYWLLEAYCTVTALLDAASILHLGATIQQVLQGAVLQLCYKLIIKCSVAQTQCRDAHHVAAKI
jgi:hypothetical protein